MDIGSAVTCMENACYAFDETMDSLEWLSRMHDVAPVEDCGADDLLKSAAHMFGDLREAYVEAYEHMNHGHGSNEDTDGNGYHDDSDECYLRSKMREWYGCAARVLTRSHAFVDRIDLWPCLVMDRETLACFKQVDVFVKRIADGSFTDDTRNDPCTRMAETVWRNMVIQNDNSADRIFMEDVLRELDKKGPVDKKTAREWLTRMRAIELWIEGKIEERAGVASGCKEAVEKLEEACAEAMSQIAKFT